MNLQERLAELKLGEGEELIERFLPLPQVHEHDDLADEYAIVRNSRASHGLMLYVKWHDRWECGNSWSHRPVIRYLCDVLDKNQAAYEAALTALESSHRERDRLKQRLDGVYGALADAATVVVSTDNPGESVRSLIAERDRLAADNHRLRLGDMSAMDYERLVEWINNPQRQVSHLAFTAGAARTAAKAIEDSCILSELRHGVR